MTIFVATCDKYDHLLPGFCRQFNKYWGEHQMVTILGFRTPPELPANFQFHSMEPVETQPCTTNLHRFFSSIEDPHFTFLLDDYWLIAPVNPLEIHMMEREVVIGGAVKGDLSQNTLNFEHLALPNGLVEAAPSAHYRTSTQPCIWSRQFFLELMSPGMNPWEFELQDSETKQHGRIVGPRHQIYQFANVYYKGAPDTYMIEKILFEDREALFEMGAFKGILP